MNKLRFAFCLSLTLFGLINCCHAANLPFLNQNKIRLSIKPGDTGYGEIIVTNPTQDVRAMNLYLEDWRYLPPADGSKEFFQAGSLENSCAPWINFSPAEFTLAPFGTQRVSYSVKVPENAKGGYYATLFFETEVAQLAGPDKSAGINLRVRIASLFYVEAAGTIKRQGEIDNFKISRDNQDKPLALQIDFKNIGNVDITAGGTYHIIDSQGMILARGEFNDLYTFPQDKGTLKAEWSQSIPKGTYDLVVTLNYGKALEEAKVGRGPIETKESKLEFDAAGKLAGFTKLE